VTKKEYDIIYKLYKALYIPGVTNPCDIKAVVDYNKECNDKIQIVRRIINSLLNHDCLECVQGELEKLENVIKKYE
jgi:hypothetical protein